MFEIRVVRATEGQSWCQVRKQMAIIKESLFDLLYNKDMLSVLRILTRYLYVHSDLSEAR